MKATTYDSYERTIRLHVLPRLGNVQLQSLTAVDLDGLYAHLLTDGRRNAGGGGLSVRSVRHVHSIVRKALADALRKGRVARNVADAADPPRATGEAEMEYWTPEEVRRFLDHVESDDVCALWQLAVATGMRRGELVGLRWENVDLDAGQLLEPKQL